ncbi:MAG: hypothetical protein ABI183_09230 [Polyangiaceae bacterium]
MRITILFVCASVAACGSSPKTAAPASHATHATPKPSDVPAPKSSASVEVAPDIVDVTAPKGACVVAGRSFEGFDLSGTAEGPSLLRVGPGDAKLNVSNRVTFAEVVTTTVTLRGFVSQNPTLRRAFVYPRKWLSFGGVYFPGIQKSLHVFGEHNGNLVLDAPDLTPLTLTQKNRWAEVRCDEVSLAPDPSSNQRTDLPPAFLPASTKQMSLEGTESIAISAEPHGEVAGAIHLENRPWDGALAVAVVDVLETNGDQTHIRWDHLAGWVPTARLSRMSPNTVKMAEWADTPGARDRDPGEWFLQEYQILPTTLLICAEDVSVAASSEKDAGWFVMGTIPAGQPVRVSAMNDTFSLLKLDGLSTTAASSGIADTWRPRSWAGTWNIQLAGCKGALDTARRKDFPSVDFVNDFISHAILIDTVDALVPQVRRSGAVNPPKLYPDLRPAKGQRRRYYVGPVVVEDAVHTSGPLSSEVVARVTRQSFPEFAVCAQRARQWRGASGEVKFRFEIDRAGHVSSIVDVGSNGPSLEPIGCVARGISRILFPPPTTAKEIVDYSMHL